MDTICRKPRDRRNGESGQTLVEHAGMAIVVALIIAAIIATGLGTAASDLGKQIVCKIVEAIDGSGQGGNCAGGSEEQAKDPRVANPKTVPSAGDYASTTSELGWNSNTGTDAQKIKQQQRQKQGKSPGKGKAGPAVSASDGQKYSRMTYQDGSGSRTLTSTTAVDGGLAFQVDKEQSAGQMKMDATLKAHAKAGITYSSGQTWKCDGPGQTSCSEFDSANQGAVGDNLGNQGLGRVISLWDEPEKFSQTPDSETTTWEGKIDVDAKASSKTSGGSVSNTSAAEIGGEVKFARTATEQSDGTKSTSYRYSYEGKLAAESENEAFGEAKKFGGSGSYTGGFEFTYDDNGKLKSITFTEVMEGQSKGTLSETIKNSGVKASADANGNYDTTSTVKTTLDVSGLSESDRQIAENYASNAVGEGAIFVPDSVLYPESPSSDPFDNLLYEKASTVRYVEVGASASVKDGVEVGPVSASGTGETGNSATVETEQLGLPGGDGKRRYEPLNN